MIKISQIKINIAEFKDASSEQEEVIVERFVLKLLKIRAEQLNSFKIVKKSIDARKKNEIKYIYTVEVSIADEAKKIKMLHNPNIILDHPKQYAYKPEGREALTHRPVVVGTGPGGLFCALFLAEHGYRPIVIERGEDVDSRMKQVQSFWNGNPLNPNSNVQFGEGGAGTFSDGKLNTLVKDVSGRNTKVLDTFVEYGAPSEILYLNKPHIGTDLLVDVVKNMRKRIIELGGDVRFGTQFTDLKIENGLLTEIQLNQKEWFSCDVLVLAIGHSARDTFSLLHKKGFTMTPKAFAIGVRVEHEQELISKAQYGESYEKLPPADYKLTHTASNGRSIYSFCMCPGGFVVNASSEENHLVVNGMSNYKRDEKNSNSALIVSVTPEDFAGEDPLAGVEFQRKWESLAYKTGKGSVPVQLFGDFRRNKISTSFGKIIPDTKGMHQFGNLKDCLPTYVSETIIEGMDAFQNKIHGFGNEEAVFSGVETRTSSPVRIVRDENFESSWKGIFPCGEGAGYAGGITSAAIDGIKVFEAITSKYKPIG